MSSEFFDLDQVPPAYRECCAEVNARRARSNELRELAEELSAHFRATGEGKQAAIAAHMACIRNTLESLRLGQRLHSRLTQDGIGEGYYGR